MAKKQIPLFDTEIKKKCTKCGGLKGLDGFYNSNYTKSGKKCSCKSCSKSYYAANKDHVSAYNKRYGVENRDRISKKQKEYKSKNEERGKEYQREYYLKNKVKRIEYQTEYRHNNKDKVRARKTKYYFANREKIVARKKIWIEKNIDEIRRKARKYYRETTSKDPRYVIGRRVARGMRDALIKGKNGKSWETFVDYNVDDLIKYFKRKNRKIWDKFVANPSDYHIDHIIPVTAFNFDAPDQIDFKKCFDMKNLQILTASENLSKHDKLSAPFQPSLNFSFRQG